MSDSGVATAGETIDQVVRILHGSMHDESGLSDFGTDGKGWFVCWMVYW